MKSIYIASVGANSGKSVLSLGLAMNFTGKVGFYKPFRENPIKVNGELVEQDVLLMASVLGSEEKASDLSPFVYDIFDPVSMDDIVERYKRLSKGKELMIVEGSKGIANGCTHSVSHLDISKKINAPAVLMSTTDPTSIDSVFIFKQLCEQRKMKMPGVVLNRSSDSPERKFLESHGIKVFGEIPPMPELRTFRVSEIAEKLNTKVIAGSKGVNANVETMVVGAMSAQSAVNMFRRQRRKAVITCADRTEVQLAALSTDTSCLIITGGLRPMQMVLSKAEDAGIPVLTTDEDVMTIMEILGHLSARVDPNDREKLDMIKKSVRKGVDLDEILEL